VYGFTFNGNYTNIHAMTSRSFSWRHTHSEGEMTSDDI